MSPANWNLARVCQTQFVIVALNAVASSLVLPLSNDERQVWERLSLCGRFYFWLCNSIHRFHFHIFWIVPFFSGSVWFCFVLSNVCGRITSDIQAATKQRRRNRKNPPNVFGLHELVYNLQINYNFIIYIRNSRNVERERDREKTPTFYVKNHKTSNLALFSQILFFKLISLML